MTHTLTDEQAAARDAFRHLSGKNLVVQAYAGAGKTSTLRDVAAAVPLRNGLHPRIGQYVAFNKGIVTDAAGKMPPNVNCSTMHSLAMRSVGRRFAHRLSSERMQSNDIAARLMIYPATVTVMGKPKVIQKGRLAGHVMRALAEFCKSADPEPTVRHFPYMEGIDDPDPTDPYGRGRGNNRAIAKVLLPALRKLWDDAQDPNGILPYRADRYLKLFQLSEPQLGVDFVMVDEAQDISPVMMSIVDQQPCRVVWVGDSAQAINEWNGAVDALTRIHADATCHLSRSFRFGPEIAEAAQLMLDQLGIDPPIIGAGAPGRVEPCADPDAILTRTNAVAMSTVLQLRKDGRRPHLVGNGTEMVAFAKAALSLQQRRWTEHPELACFDSWGQVQDYVDQDQLGGELKLQVELIDEYGAEVIIDAVENMPTADAAEVVVSTTHKSKGLEWERVQLAGDFPADDLEPADLRLLYVAATRARQVLDVSRAGAFGGDDEDTWEADAARTA
jgi:hypothetical protein